MQPRTLLNTADRADAGFCGYPGPVCPHADGEGFILTQEADGWMTLTGPEGSVQLPPRAAVQVARAMLGVRAARKVAA